MRDIGPRRWFVGIGVGDYNDETLNLGKALYDVERMTEWFTAGTSVKHEAAVTDLARNPTWARISGGLADFLEPRTADEVVVVYIACHGEEEGGEAYLFGSDTPRTKLAARALSAKQIGALLGSSRPHNVLILIDACVAGQIAAEISDAARKAARAENSRDPQRQYAQVLISSAFGLSPAQDGAFADAFLRAVSDERWTGTVTPWISIERLLEAINHELSIAAPGQRVDCSPWFNGEIHLVPNPNVGRRKGSALFNDDDFAAHFDPASRGVSRSESGSFFTGRTDELARATGWLRQARDGTRDQAVPAFGRGNMLVVTGSPGSGKSALLSRIAVLSSPDLRDSSRLDDPSPADAVPELGALDAAIWCRGKTHRQIIAELARTMGGAATTPETLMALAKMRGDPLVVAVDALDEAVSGEAEKIASEVLAPLASDTPLHFLVATRRRPVGGGNVDLLEQLAAAAPVLIDLDVAKKRQEDITDYVARRLAARGFASGKGEEGGKLAEAIAKAAGNSFLVASIAARSVKLGEVSVFRLPSEVGEALAAYLDRLPDPESARDVLRPLAWAQGPGLPWGTVWPMMATRVRVRGSALINDAAIKATLDTAGDLVVESVDRGEPVYRLFHEALAQHFRETTPSPRVAERRIAGGMLDMRDDRPWSDVPRYVRAYLPAFLTSAGMGEELIALLLDPAWIRQRRLDTSDSLAVLQDVDNAVAKFKEMRRLNDIAQLSYQYSQLITTGLPPLIELLARAGQSVRAEAMAGNLEDIADRMIIFKSLAAIHGKNGDIAAAARDAEEVMRGLPAMHADHRPMAWCWAAEALMAAGQLEGARHAAAEALDAVALNDEWDRQNGLFWAAMAARVSESEGVRERIALQIELLAKGGALFRNQILQAAAVAGCTNILKAKLAEVTAGGPESHSPTRIGNLGLALADAGLEREMAKLVAYVGPKRYLGEEDSLKRWSWALARSGRYDAAVKDRNITSQNSSHLLRDLV
ncbi:caspase family protein [Rhizobium ruizarguesonis]